jgi:hypothetical protein
VDFLDPGPSRVKIKLAFHGCLYVDSSVCWGLCSTSLWRWLQDN